MKDQANQFDLNVTRSVQSVPAKVGTVLAIITYIGLPAVTAALAVTLVAVFYFGGQPRIALVWIAALIALGCNTIIKITLQRTRPDTVYVSQMRFKSYSFPSGHAFGSLVVYGLLAEMAYRQLPQPGGLLAAVILGVVVIAIGTSRVYLGAHFPTDVAGAWLLGAVFLGAILVLIRL